MPPPRIIVFGGSGFLGTFFLILSILTEGSHICRSAIQRQCQVTSISRSGGPPHSLITYQKGDIFSPEQYRTVLKGADAVIYSAGMLLEGDYKSLARGEFELHKVIGLLRQDRNPLTRSHGYDSLNRDGGIFPIKMGG
jgi:putative NADH-flavin reductase